MPRYQTRIEADRPLTALERALADLERLRRDIVDGVQMPHLLVRIQDIDAAVRKARDTYEYEPADSIEGLL